MGQPENSGGSPSAGRPARQRRLQSWPEAWVRALSELTTVSPARLATVLRDIDEGSKPTAVYYALLGLSELIAGFALMVNSDATLIGANVVAPLMTPIFGVSLGLMRGDLRLLRAALAAEFGGALFGVVLCYLLGLVPFMLEPTPLLLSQTQPTLIDLFVATLAGIAGALAMIDERVSPALPGVAIATALNPPIAAIGLCLAVGAYEGAWGALVLFLANVLAILAVAAILFIVAGFVTRAEMGSLRGLRRRFAVPVIGLLLVTGLLTSHLLRVVNTLRTSRAITRVLDDELSREPNTVLVNVEFSRNAQAVEVLSTVRTPRVMAPERVKRIQEALAGRLGEPVRLFMRCGLTKDVTATGSTNLRPYLSLNGKVTEHPLAPEMQLLQQAEQVAREVVATRPDIVLQDVEMVAFPSGPVLLASIQSASRPSSAAVARVEALLRERLAESRVRVVVRVADSVDITSKGQILFGEAHFGEVTADEASRRQAVEEAVRDAIQDIPDLFVTAIDAVRHPPGWAVRAEVFSPRVPAPSDIRGVEARARTVLGDPVEISLRSHTELVVTAAGYRAVGDMRRTEKEEE